jgi:MFS transporter, ACS family, solute carrier family 17 (sodium-dependent inorganic phosphate cotransporter), other
MNLAHTAAVSTGWQQRYNIVGLCVLAVFICYIDRVNISVAAIAMQEDLGWSNSTKGLVLSSFFVGYMLFMVPSGWMSNRLGGKIVLGAAVVWWSIFTILTPLAALVSLPVLVATRVLMGMGEAATFPAAYTLFGRWVPPNERSRAVSLLLGGIPLGTLFALTTTGWLVAKYGWPIVFYLFGAIGLVWSVLWYKVAYATPEEHPKLSDKERELLLLNERALGKSEKIPWKRLLSAAPVWALIINHFCSNWGFYVLLAWLPSYFRTQLGLSIASAGIYSALPWLTMFICGNLAGLAADKMVTRGISTTFVRKSMQCTGLIGSSVFLLLAIDVSDATHAMILMCGALGFLALTWSGFVPNHLDIAPRYADILMGITNTAGTIPGIIGVFVTGWLVDTTGTFSAPFLVAAGINIFGALVWLAFGTAERVID